MAAYNRQQISALGEHCEVEVISPIPWPELRKHKLKQASREENGMAVHHPTYYYTPRILRAWYGEYFYYSIKSVATQLLNKQEYDVIYSSWLYPDSWAAAKLAKQFKLPLYVKVHGTDVNRLEQGSAITRRSMEIVRQTEKVICVSKALKDRLIELGAPENKLVVLYNGVDQTIFHPIDREEACRTLMANFGEFLVLYVGNLKKDKGLDELVTAFKTLTETATTQTRLIIIGSGSYKSSAVQQVTSLGLSSKVQFLGSQSLETIALWMNAASVLCLPSYMEGVPNVVLEALSCCTKVVATSVGGIPELDRGDGMLILVPPCDSSALAESLLMLSRSTDVVCKSSFITSWRENGQRLYSLFFGVL
jgi:glycosyltransferase involved in cell wall biosynthesis